MLRTLRRVKQLTYLFASPAFRDSEAIRRHTSRRYSASVEVAHYAAVADAGFVDEENEIIADYLRSTLPNPRVLVVGCGAGREARAFAERGCRVVAIDLSPKMISAARSKMLGAIAIDYKCATPAQLVKERIAESFDLIFISTAIVGHIPGREERIEFYRNIRTLLARDGRVFTLPLIQRLDRKSAQYWASQVLRLRWSLGRMNWEEGDTARAFLGKHNRDFRPVFLHYYPDRAAFETEIAAGGLRVTLASDEAFLLGPAP